MSNTNAIAAVTQTLRTLLLSAVTTQVPGAQVSAKPPDTARESVPGNLVNIFLYQTAMDPAWRNQPTPPVRMWEDGPPPLPLVLSYLITAYGEGDDEVVSHQLLGAAMAYLHSNPVLSRADIAAMSPGSGLEAQIEDVRITPHPVPLDEISRMWATFQTGYRISVSYEASVVLIDNAQPAAIALPVLARGEGDVGPLVIPQLAPVLDFAGAPTGDPGVRPGEQVTVWGSNLGAVTSVVISGGAIAAPTDLDYQVSESSLVITIPANPPLPAGTATVTAQVDIGSGSPPLVSNAIPVWLVPVLTSPLPLQAQLANGSATVTVNCSPAVEAGQTTALIVGEQVFAGDTGAAGSSARTQLQFRLTGLTPDTYPVRLEVDGQRSLPFAPPEAGQPPAFDPQQTLVVSGPPAPAGSP